MKTRIEAGESHARAIYCDAAERKRELEKALPTLRALSFALGTDDARKAERKILRYDIVQQRAARSTISH